MKKIFKSRLFLIILTVIITTSIIGVSASILYQASEIGFTPKNKNWKVNNLESALNDLYENKGLSATKFCTYVNSDYVNTDLYDNSNHLSVGSKYSCDPGDGTNRNFYILANNGDTLDLIMQENIEAETMSWYNAINYFDTNTNGIAIKNAWTNVIAVDLPKAQDIANAVGRTDWIAGNNNSWWFFDKNGDSYGQTKVADANNLSAWRWLFNYTNGCMSNGCDPETNLSSGAYGYWTRNISSSTSYPWFIYRTGSMYADLVASNASYYGVRPVITVLKGNLQG